MLFIISLPHCLIRYNLFVIHSPYLLLCYFFPFLLTYFFYLYFISLFLFTLQNTECGVDFTIEMLNLLLVCYISFIGFFLGQSRLWVSNWIIFSPKVLIIQFKSLVLDSKAPYFLIILRPPYAKRFTALWLENFAQ